MTNPYTAPIPPAPRPPDARPLRKRALVWLGGSALFLTGVLIGSTGDAEQQPVEAKVRPATTVTATATTTATPEPAPTVTETVKVKAKPAPTVTVTRTAAARVAGAGGGSGSTGGSGTTSRTGTCSIVSNAGNCYSAGQFCRNSDHGAVTSTASGTTIKCVYSANAWRWTAA
ncbi:hypothetical protein AB0465_10520 [Streptomyces griseoviridis]|uniref:Uncharacterized protein n=1 Tax=Streptomyces griseoviridis TaxID=45398 RepID=A0A3Q9KWT2_STRGD|nr:hypothetical protein [Streptomyces griseoviridis]AZS86275.1 hypothetical protein ELQ87_19870 [Streptomyces griseoviridis]QCN86863.1 hypothetical protein DDJ31_19415 [Streptomyces griseoviridis]